MTAAAPGRGDYAVLRALGGKTLRGRIGYGVSCVLASMILVAAGIGYYAQQALNGTSNVLAGGASTGPMTILIMGLESRTYWDGTPIDHHLQYILNVGSAGGNATNTLILLHIFGHGQKAVAFSIPRDDYVQMVGTLGFGPSMSKIDNAYGYAMAQQMTNDLTAHPTWSFAQRSLDGNEAGRLAEVETVEALTGVKIDKFAELNLVGFYELAKVFNGIEVCVDPWPGGDGVPANGNLRDPVVYEPGTGWQGSGSVVVPGIQHLSPEQTLDFVRNRHNLPGGDIARTYRQQAVLDYVLWDLRNSGVLSDVSRLSSLVSIAQQYLAFPKGWNLVQFGAEMNALNSQDLTFTTLPETAGPDIPSVGSVNNVNVPQIQAEVQQAFSAPPEAGLTTPASPSEGDAVLAKKAPASPATPAPSSDSASSPSPGSGSGNPYALTPAEQAWAKKAKAEYGIPCVY
jgi:anionic cell wall polymer biosynthesis LytR-Cps2A-Psr (LCP) family protein